MEPAKTKIRYIIEVEVVSVIQDMGVWWVHFLGSWESLQLGEEKPDFKAGDKVRITIERITPSAQPR
jgi:hypothetical protein